VTPFIINSGGIVVPTMLMLPLVFSPFIILSLLVMFSGRPND
jgi:hypothetical protein